MHLRRLALLAIAAAAAGCGNGEMEAMDAAPGEAAEREAWNTSTYAGCELVSAGEIQAALGETVVSQEEGGWYGCRWKTESYVVGLSAFADTSLPEDSCTLGATSMPYGKTAFGKQETVAGLGDKAVWGSSGDLHVCTGRGLLTLDVEDSPIAPDEERDVAILLARSALGRLEPDGR